MAQKFPEIPKAVEFMKCKPGSKVEWKENFQEKSFENLGTLREVVLFIRKIN